MATKSFAIPLDSASKQPGDITFEELKNNSSVVQFRLTFAAPGATNELNLITCKKANKTDHKFGLIFDVGTAQTKVSAAQISAIFADANNGDWDYVQALWTVGSVDFGGSSNNYEVQGGRTYDSNGWPPAH